jgi:hypothetical protein
VKETQSQGLLKFALQLDVMLVGCGICMFDGNGSSPISGTQIACNKGSSNVQRRTIDSAV